LRAEEIQSAKSKCRNRGIHRASSATTALKKPLSSARF
jgi:hypothetical protein